MCLLTYIIFFLEKNREENRFYFSKEIKQEKTGFSDKEKNRFQKDQLVKTK